MASGEAVIVVFVIILFAISGHFSSYTSNDTTENTQESVSKIETDEWNPKTIANAPQKQESVSTLPQKEPPKETPNNLESLDERAEKRMLEYVNELRAEKGIGKMVFAKELSNIAHISSKISADDNELDSDHSFALKFDCSRIGGHRTSSVAEVLAVDQGANLVFYQLIPEHVGERLIDDWMSSKTGHREALLNPTYVLIGFGVTPSITDVYASGVFCPAR